MHRISYTMQGEIWFVRFACIFAAVDVVCCIFIVAFLKSLSLNNDNRERGEGKRQKIILCNANCWFRGHTYITTFHHLIKEYKE